jgi:hypothetical protein
MRFVKLCKLAMAFLIVLCLSGQGFADLYGPTHYVQASDSPFHGLTLGYFYLEDFEDGALNTLGVSVSAGYSTKLTFPALLTDSVDADDGFIDGQGNDGNSWWWWGDPGLTFTFDSSVLGSLPTHAGIVWTDGDNPVTFKAFNSSGSLLGTIGPSYIADGSYNGTTADDNFFGISDPGGIWKISISNGGGGGIEVDHLQYGNPVPVPGAALLGAIGLSFAGWRLKRKTL